MTDGRQVVSIRAWVHDPRAGQIHVGLQQTSAGRGMGRVEIRGLGRGFRCSDT